MMGGISWSMSLGGRLWMIGGLILVVALVVLLVRGLSGPAGAEHGGSRSQATALEVLRERFGRGEITEAEFEQARKTLGYA
jgi:uncharacterized membrane protein